MHFPFVESCPESYPRMPGLYAELFDTPWEQSPRTVWFCSDRCEESYCFSGDFEYSFCDCCGRKVCSQNPSNGWQVQYRSHRELGEVCLRCYEEEITKNGQPRSDFEGNQILGGMFFSWGNREPVAAGFDEVEGFSDCYITNHDSARRYNSHALGLVNSGHKVLTAYERMGIGGTEGYITMMSKPIKR
jgi:hypothetical protein